MTHQRAQAVTHPLLDLPGVRHGFFTRVGGVSTGIYEGLNAGLGSSDDPAAVRRNRALIAEAMGGTPADYATPYQIHSAVCHVADGPWGDRRPEGDAGATRTKGVICGVLTADCAPILMVDPNAGVVAAVHAGWKGALGGVIEASVTAMEGLGARAAYIRAVVGPCIAQDSYEVGADFQTRFEAEAAEAARFFRPGAAPDKRLFDLPGFVLWRLERAGVGQAAWTGDDTRVDEARFYSNRRAYLNGERDFGRQMSAIALI